MHEIEQKKDHQTGVCAPDSHNQSVVVISPATFLTIGSVFIIPALPSEEGRTYGQKT